ncbi:hypothetical protein H8N01_17830 [Streptomyces sp. AC536]|uniref:hypothetical protein n=1 Tax=Streptomyces buecherae TaxID=2763006 RepID=UPI00164E9623|nr:hypothetical protein [Streptomyces buecherae]MBC3984377.1 hypothetical protein [Streptomyces buecherae]QNJ39579.1 hypothetical protein H7H31_06510 [Streptomyces buecherae]
MRFRVRASALALAGGLAVAGCASDSASAPVEFTSQRGQALGKAEERARQAGLTFSSHDASEGDRAPRADWSVCFQSQRERSVEFAVVTKAETCPSADGRPIPWLRMPDVSGGPVSSARAELTDFETALTKGVRLVGARPGVNPHAYPGDGASDSWTVCSQRPAPGTALDERWQAKEDIELLIAPTDTRCP